MLNRAKAKLTNTEIRIEMLQPAEAADMGCNRGMALIIRIENIVYRNDAEQEATVSPGATAVDDNDEDDDDEPEFVSKSSDGKKNCYFLTAFAVHNITMENITIYTEEFTMVDCRKREQQQKQRQKEERLRSTAPFLASSVYGEEIFHSTYSTLETSSATGMSSADRRAGCDDDDRGAEVGDGDFGNDDIIEIFSSGMVQVAALNGLNEIRLTVKQAASVVGPNVELELSLGVLQLLLSPRHCHQLTVLFGAFQGEAPPKTDKEPNSSEYKSSQSMNYKEEVSIASPTTSFNHMTGGFTFNQRPVSAQSNIGSNTGTAFDDHSLEGMSSSGGSMFSYASSAAPSSITATLKSSGRGQNVQQRPEMHDNSVLESRYVFRIGGVIGTLLHDNILMDVDIVGQLRSPLTEASSIKMRELSNSYFGHLQTIDLVVMLKQLRQMDEVLDRIMRNRYHLRLILATIMLDGDETRNQKQNLMKVDVSIARARLTECLTAPLQVPLLDFVREEHAFSGTVMPEVQVAYQSVQKIRNVNGVPVYSEPVINKCKVGLIGAAVIEVDVTLYDRLKVLSDSYPFEQLPSEADSLPPSGDRDSDAKEAKRRKCQTSSFSLKVDSAQLDVNLRFPVIDMRPMHDPQRVPWWERNVRADFLTLQFRNARFMNGPAVDTYQLEAESIAVSYIEGGNCYKIADLLEDETGNAAQQRSSRPTIVFDIAACSHPDQMGRSAPPTPFSEAHVWRESETIHETGESKMLVLPGSPSELKVFSDYVMANSGMRIKLQVPTANVQLRSKHIYEVLYNRLSMDLLVWTPASQQLVAKPHVTSFGGFSDNDLLLMGAGMTDSIYAPATVSIIDDIQNMHSSSSSSGSTDGSDGEDDDEMLDTRLHGPHYGHNDEAAFRYSMQGHMKYSKERPSPIKYKTKYPKWRRSREQMDAISELVFALAVDRVTFGMFPPSRNAQNQVIPEQWGQVLLRGEAIRMYFVKGFTGDDNLSYLSLEADKLSAFHCDMVPGPVARNLPLMGFQTPMPDYLLETLCTSSSSDITTTEPYYHEQGKRKMLTLAIRIKAMPEQQIKRIELATAVKNATLKYSQTPTMQPTWIMELLDLFDVIDYPIPGYMPVKVVTTTHLHLWDCAIDYRPLRLKHRAVVTLGNFMFNTSVTTLSHDLTMRLVVEDATLAIAEYDSKKECTVDQLACILELGLFEASCRTNGTNTGDVRHTDIRVTLNDVHLRICADSARAIHELGQHVYNQGDLNKDPSSDGDSPITDGMAGMSMSTVDLLGNEEHQSRENNRRYSESDYSLLHKRLEEAMMESQLEPNRNVVPHANIMDDDDDAISREMFYFPDEAVGRVHHRNASAGDSESSTELKEEMELERSTLGLPAMFYGDEEDDMALPMPQVSKDLGRIEKKQKVQPKVQKSDTDDEFCIIGDEERAALQPPLKPDPRVLHDNVESVRIVDNHFGIAAGKEDLLSTPAGFPRPNFKFTLLDCNVSLCIYGGSDFAPKPTEHGQDEQENIYKEKLRKIHLPMSDVYRQGVSFASSGMSGQAKKTHPATLNWKRRGGWGRRHDVTMQFNLNRMRLCFERFSPTCKYTSRVVLLIHEFEIKDRLLASDYNKFFYRDASELTKAKRDMLTVNALNIRPDVRVSDSECCLSVFLANLRLHIDQDAVLFLFNFFQECNGQVDDKSTAAHSYPTDGPMAQGERLRMSNQPEPVLYVPPTMTDSEDVEKELMARKMVAESLQLLTENTNEGTTTAAEAGASEALATGPSALDKNGPIFIRRFTFETDVRIRIDYRGKRVELSRGPLAGLIMGIAQLQSSVLTLKAISSRY